MAALAKPHVTFRYSVWAIRWTLSASLLLAGVIALSVPPPTTGVWWLKLNSSPVALWLPLPTRLLSLGLIISVLTMAIFLERRTLRDQLRSALASSGADFTWIFWLGLYISCIAVIYELINSTDTTNHVLQLSEVCCTAILALAAGSSWCLGAIPATIWRRWYHDNLRRLPLIAGLGALAYILARHFTPTVIASAPVLMGPLQAATLSMSAVLLQVFVPNLVFEPKKALIGTSNFAVYLDPGCSGLEGIALFIAVFALYLIFYRPNLRFPNVFLLIPVGVCLLWFLNLVRIVAMILLGNWSDSLGVNGFHSVAGWLFFNAATLGIIATSQHLTYFTKQADSCPPSQRAANTAVPYLMPLLVIIAIGMIVQPFSQSLCYPLQVIAGSAVLWLWARTTLFRLRWSASWSAIFIGIVVYGVWVFASRPEPASQTLGASVMLPGALAGTSRQAWMTFRLLGTTLVAPIAEEMAFRGYLLRRLVAADFEAVPQARFTWFSFLASSLIFGALHQQWYLGVFAGMAFAFAAYRRGRLSDAIVSHAVANGLLALSVLLTGNWLLWK